MEVIRVCDAMSTSPFCVSKHASTFDVIQLMNDRNVGGVLVVDDSRLLGIITRTDILHKLRGNPNSLPAVNVMTRGVITIQSNADISAAAELMVKKDIRRIPVVDRGVLKCIITQTDLLRIQPSLVELLVSKFSAHCNSDIRSFDGVSGLCDSCGRVEFLKESEGRMLCSSCRI